MFPVAIGDACIYLRNVPGPKPEDPHKRVRMTAIMLAYDPLPAGADENHDVPTAHLAIVHPDRLHLFRDAGWTGAFEKIDGVPYEPQGEFYQGWCRVEDALIEDLQASGDMIVQLRKNLEDLQTMNTFLVENNVQLQQRVQNARLSKAAETPPPGLGAMGTGIAGTQADNLNESKPANVVNMKPTPPVQQPDNGPQNPQTA